MATRSLPLLMIALLFGCAARQTPKPQVWIVRRGRGLSFQVQGRTGWYRLPQGDSTIKAGDTIYINHPGHKREGYIHKWNGR